MKDNIITKKLYTEVIDLLNSARHQVVRSINRTMVVTYFEIGRKIVEEEQNGLERAAYGRQLLNELSEILTNQFGRGFSVDNLENMRKFYMVYGNSETLSRKFNLSWSHYLKLIRIEDENERNFYEIEAFNNNWSVRELQRQFDSALYSRLSLSRDKDKIKELSEKGLIYEKPQDAVKDPYIL